MATTTSTDLISGAIDVLIMRYEHRNFNGIVRVRIHDFLERLCLVKTLEALPPFTAFHIKFTKPRKPEPSHFPCHGESRVAPRTLRRLPRTTKKYLSPPSSSPNLPPLLPIYNFNHSFRPQPTQQRTPRNSHLNSVCLFFSSSSNLKHSSSHNLPSNFANNLPHSTRSQLRSDEQSHITSRQYIKLHQGT